MSDPGHVNSSEIHRCAWTGCNTTEGFIRRQWSTVHMADGEECPLVSYYCPYHDVVCFGTPEMQAEMGLWEQ